MANYRGDNTNMSMSRLWKKAFTFDDVSGDSAIRVLLGSSSSPSATETKQDDIITVLNSVLVAVGGTSASVGTGTIQLKSLVKDADTSFLPSEYGPDANKANITIAGDNATDYVEYVANGTWASDGSAPRGHRVYAGGTIALTSRYEVQNFKVIAKSTGVQLIAEFATS